MDREKAGRGTAEQATGATPAGGRREERQFVVALARGLEILGCFSAGRRQLGVTEIATILGLAQPTAWRLCHTLTELGFLQAEANGRLSPALAVLRLGYAAFSDLSPAELVRPHLQELASRHGAAAGLAVPDGAAMRFIARCEGDSQLLLHLRVGSRVPVATSALGWAYLAALPEAERAGAAGSDTQAWRAAQPAFGRAMRGFARSGFIVNPGVLHPGYHTAAVPVRGTDGRPVMALNCGAAASALPAATLRDEIGPALCRLAELLEAVV
ncbi:MAG: IclR family transcriptional regulator [Janthinobacterium lividum]